MIFSGAKVFTEEGFKQLDFEVMWGDFFKIEESIPGNNIKSLNGRYVIPGLVDIHTHGIGGYDFGDASVGEMKTMADFYIKNGTTSLLPTLVSLNEADYEKQIESISKNRVRFSPYVGINLEGPFINKEKKGAHNENNIHDISIELAEKLWRISGKIIRLMTAAPELDGFDELFNFAEGKFKLSVGHSACDTETVKKVFDMGINHVTHLFNAMNSMHHREPSIVGMSLEYPVIKELICDGIHVDDTILKVLFKKYPDELAIISDSIAACCLGDGSYKLGGLDVTVSSKKAALSDGTIAGSANTLLDNVKHLISLGVKMDDAIKSATIIPAKAIKMDHVIGSIKIAKQADFIVCDKNLNIIDVYKCGEIL